LLEFVFNGKLEMRIECRKFKKELPMKKLLISLFLLIGVLTGCSNQSKAEDTGSNEVPKMVEVTIKTIPQQLIINKSTKIEALVTQGNDKVSDASEVKFELWKSGQDKHEMFKAKNEGNGIYSISKTFQTSGKYFVTAHVTAREMHVMPNQQFTVNK
jgi:uncharacterized lipoprotein NlpE involved in copper resistance